MANGLFDMWGGSPGDQASLAMAASLLGGRGNLGGILGDALTQSQGAYTKAQQADMQRQLQQASLDQSQQSLEQQRQAALDAQQVRQFWSNQQNYMQPSRQAPGDFGPGEAPQLPASPMGPRGVAQNMLASGSPALAQQGFQGLQKSFTPTELRPGATIGSFDPETGKFNPAYTAPKEVAPSPLADLIAERSKLPPGHPMTKVYDAAIEKASTHQPPIVQMGLGSPVAVTGPNGQQMLVQPPTKPGGKAEIVQIGGVAVTPSKNNAAMNPGQAAQVAMMEQGSKNIDDFSAKIFVPTGDPSAPVRLNKSLLANVNLPLGSIGGEARESRTAIRNAIEARLRLESGAAVPETEVDRALDRFMPKPWDSVESAQYKLGQLKQFFGSAISMTKAGNAASPMASDQPSSGKVVKWADLK